MWHYANYHGKELLIIGYSTRRGDCFLADLAALPMNESTELRRIAQSRAGQEQECLVPLLQNLHSPDGARDWFSYLMLKTQQRNGPVFLLPLKDIQDSIEEDQRAIFKGYGKGRRNKYLDTLVETPHDDNIPSLNSIKGGDLPVNTPVADRSVNGHFADTKASPSDIGYKMDMMLETLVDESRKTQTLLNKLIGALTTDAVAENDAPAAWEERDRPAKQPRRNSRSSKKAVSSAGDAEGAQV